MRKHPFHRIGVRLLVVLSLLPAACQPPPHLPEPGPDARAAEATRSIHVASNGWHSAIVVAAADLSPGAIPETADFSHAAYFEFSWGDAAYFPARDPSFFTALSAALVPTPSVVHLGGLRHPPGIHYPEGEVIELTVSTTGFNRLVDYLKGTFDRGDGRRARAGAPGLNSYSRFYPATGSFHLFNTCNSWTARGLRTAGLPIEDEGAVDAETLMSRVRSLRADRGPRLPTGHAGPESRN